MCEKYRSRQGLSLVCGCQATLRRTNKRLNNVRKLTNSLALCAELLDALKHQMRRTLYLSTLWCHLGYAT